MSADHPSKSAGPREAATAGLRVLASIASLLLAYFMFPVDDGDSYVVGAVGVIVGLAIFGWIFARQLAKVRSAAYPVLRAVEAVAVVATLFIVVMASVALGLSASDADYYSEQLSHIDAVYFTVTTLATVGFGDITPTHDLTRAITTVQIVLGVALVGAGVRVLFGVAQRTAEARRAEPPRTEPPQS